MNRSLLIALVLFLVLGVFAFSLLNKEEKKTTLETSDWNMAVENIDDIYHIFIADRQGEKVDLKRKKNHWVYNEKWKARPNAMENILNAIGKVTLKERPANNAVKNIVKIVSTQGVKVELYDKKDEKIKAYYIGGVTPDERGTYMMLEGSNNPYVMHLPFWEGGLLTRFFVGDKNWRDKTVFAFEPEELASLSMEYPQNKNKSFVLSKEGKKWKVDPFYKTTKEINTNIDVDAIDEFLVGFKSLGAEAFENDYDKRDSIAAVIPFVKINLRKKDGMSKTVNIHPLKYQKIEEEGAPVPHERYFADMNNEWNDFMLIQHIVFEKTFWAYEHFFMRERK